jgi:steroid delta-isomerase-like uncharacterized protein
MKVAIWAVITLLFAVSGSAADSPPAEVLGRSLIEVWESGNVDDLDSIMSANSSYVAAQQGHAYEGLAEVKRYVGHVVHFATALEIEVLSATSMGSTAVIEWEMRGIQNRPIPGWIEIATGKRFSLRGVTIVEVENGLIHKATDYMNVLDFVVQLGARLELPGGVVLGAE